jgi:hypothetical protein
VDYINHNNFDYGSDCWYFRILTAHPHFGIKKTKIRQTFDAGVAAMIQEFYQNDEHSRQLPGKKDSVSVSKNVHVQK